MQDAAVKPEGLRQRKRRETLQRISEVGLELFVAKGYESTTLDDIAAAAGISRRTFFYYFESKEDILQAYVGSYAAQLKALVIDSASDGAAPLDVVRHAVLKLVAPQREATMIATARLVRQSEMLRTRHQGTLRQLEQAVLEGLCELWPRKENRDRWRIVAMISIGALRLASDTWIEQDGKRPLAKYVQEMFKRLKTDT